MNSAGSQPSGFVVTLPDGRKHVMYEPFAKQREFHASTIRHLCALGSRNSGKSRMLRNDAHARALACPGSNLVIVRNTYKELIQSHVNFQGGSLQEEMALLGGRYNAGEYTCYYPNGSRLFLTYVGTTQDSLRLLSVELLAAYYDEISTIPWEFFLKLNASVRVTRDKPWKPVIRAATNPIGESATEIRKYFVDKDVDLMEDRDYDPDDWGYIQINMEDNPYINSDEYKRSLASLPPHLKKAWVEGVFSEENALFNFQPTRDGKPYHVVDDLDIPKLIKASRIYRVFDMGWNPDPAYCAWIAHLGNRYVVFHEQQWKETIAADIAADIKETDEMLGIERVYATYCDPSIDVNTGVDVRTTKDVFEANGIPMECSVNKRELFASAMHTALIEEALPGVPRLTIYRRGCPYLIRAIPQMRYDTKNPMRMADSKHDHPVVSVCYFLISTSSMEQKPFEIPKPKPWMAPKQSTRKVLGYTNIREYR